ncbi:MAG: GTPase domain-containing protein [Clostridiales Family XIII bacterium]|jgi:hypothetical protein|nr:GTPase domain-containing protein [Clostridiales Family XIII bacterium]
MKLLRELSKKYRVVSVVGMAKNAGKTTVLNYLIEEAADEGIALGITSTGRDGERKDIVTGTDKPGIYLWEDTMVTTPSGLYDMSEAGLEILRVTEYSGALGEILLCRVAEAGYVQTAGPVATADQRGICREMLDRGADMVLVDGAVDRRAIAAPEASDAVILATGAALSRSVAKVVEETMHVAGLYRLPEFSDQAARRIIAENGNSGRLTVFEKKGARFPDVTTGLAAGGVLNEAIGNETKYVYLPGALTEGVVAGVSPSKLKQIAFIVKNPTKIFIDSASWRLLRKKGLRVRVLKNVEIAALTVNPRAPEGYSFDRAALLSAMREAAGGIPVLDVRYAG